MKRQNKYLTLIILILATSVHTYCQEEFVEINTVYDKLVGKWIWLKYDDEITKTTMTPSTIRNNLSLEISKDSIYRIYKDNQLQYEGKFTIEHDEELRTDEIWQYIYFRGQDTLFLNDICPDCPGNIYVRKK